MNDFSPPPPASPSRAIVTPCVMICAIDGTSGLCLGCLRSLAEIASWSRMTDEERASIMGDLPARRDRIDPALRGD